MSNRPRRAFELKITICGDTWEDVKGQFDHLIYQIEEKGQECGSISGGCTAGHIVTVDHDPTMTHQKYYEQLGEFLKFQGPPPQGCPL